MGHVKVNMVSQWFTKTNIVVEKHIHLSFVLILQILYQVGIKKKKREYT